MLKNAFRVLLIYQGIIRQVAARISITLMRVKWSFFYLHQEIFVFDIVCLSVWKISQKKGTPAIVSVNAFNISDTLTGKKEWKHRCF